MADTAVQTKNTNTLPATLMADFSEHAGAGMDAIGTEDMQIPFARTQTHPCLLYTSPSPRDGLLSRMPSSA